MIGDLEDVHRSTLQLDDEEHVELGEVHGVDGEQVRGEDALGLRGEKLPPGRPTAGSRTETVSARVRRIELAETRMPRPRSSPWMRTQPQRRFSRAIRAMSSTSSSLMGGRPGPRVDRRRRHLRLESSRCQQRSVSGVTRKERQRHRGSNRERATRLPIHRAIGDARIELALEDTHLVAEHHDLDVLVRLGPPRGSEQAEVTEGEGHGRSWSLVASTASSGQRSRFWCPTAAEERLPAGRLAAHGARQT